MEKLHNSIREQIINIFQYRSAGGAANNNGGPHRAVFLYKMPAENLAQRNDSDRILLYISRGVVKLTGYSPEDMVSGSMSYTDLILPEYWLNVWEQVQDAVRRNRPYEIEYRILTANGDEKRICEQGLVDPDPSGTVFVEGILKEVTGAGKIDGDG